MENTVDLCKREDRNRWLSIITTHIDTDKKKLFTRNEHTVELFDVKNAIVEKSNPALLDTSTNEIENFTSVVRRLFELHLIFNPWSDGWEENFKITPFYLFITTTIYVLCHLFKLYDTNGPQQRLHETRQENLVANIFVYLPGRPEVEDNIKKELLITCFKIIPLAMIRITKNRYIEQKNSVIAYLNKRLRISKTYSEYSDRIHIIMNRYDQVFDIVRFITTDSNLKDVYLINETPGMLKKIKAELRAAFPGAYLSGVESFAKHYNIPDDLEHLIGEFGNTIETERVSYLSATEFYEFKQREKQQLSEDLYDMAMGNDQGNCIIT